MASREAHDPGHDVGRLINTISHQLKRQMRTHGEEDNRSPLYYVRIAETQRIPEGP